MRYTKEDKETIFHHIKKYPHHTLKDVGEKFNASQSIIREIVKSYNYTEKRNLYYKIITHFLNYPYKTSIELGKRFKKDPKYIRKIINQHGISIKKEREKFYKKKKVCKVCHKEKQQKNFYKDSRSVCKTCHKEIAYKNISNNMQRHVEYTRRYEAKNKKKMTEYRKRYYHYHMSKLSDSYMKNLLNLRFKRNNIKKHISENTLCDFEYIINQNKKKIRIEREIRKTIKQG